MFSVYEELPDDSVARRWSMLGDLSTQMGLNGEGCIIDGFDVLEDLVSSRHVVHFPGGHVVVVVSLCSLAVDFDPGVDAWDLTIDGHGPNV